MSPRTSCSVSLFGFKRDEVTRGWRNLLNEERHHLYSPPDIRMIKSWMSCEGDKKFTQNFCWKPEVARFFGRPMRRWVDYIKMNLWEAVGGCGVGLSCFR